MLRWEDADRFVIEEAERDLRDGLDVRPAMLAWRGDDPLFVAFVRPFERGGYRQPLIELLALAAGLDADRLLLSLAGRAWSLDDPIVPATEGADLRQRVLAIHRIDGHRRRATGSSTVVQFDVGERNEVRWGDRLELPEGEGWIAAATVETVRQRAKLRLSTDEVARQALRCTRLGHVVALAPEVAGRLGLDTEPAHP